MSRKKPVRDDLPELTGIMRCGPACLNCAHMDPGVRYEDGYGYGCRLDGHRIGLMDVSEAVCDGWTLSKWEFWYATRRPHLRLPMPASASAPTIPAVRTARQMTLEAWA